MRQRMHCDVRCGQKRIPEKDARLGFHAAINPDPTEGAAGVFHKALSPFGVDKGFIVRVEAFEPPALWYPTRKSL